MTKSIREQDELQKRKRIEFKKKQKNNNTKEHNTNQNNTNNTK